VGGCAVSSDAKAPVSEGDVIPEGSRNGTLMEMAGAMRRRGATQASIIAALRQENQDRCRPPLPDHEVEQIAHSVARYAPQEHYSLAWKPFPIDCLPEPLRSFVMQVAADMGCDPAMVTLPAMAVCAVAIGTTRRIKLKNTWKEPCIFWFAVVARSGSLKSPAMDAAVHILHRIQTNQFREFEARMAEYQREMLLHDKATRRWKGKHSDNSDPPEAPAPPKCVRYIAIDTTCEALAPILRDNPRGLGLIQDELSGWLSGFNEYKGGRGRDVSNWLQFHRAGTAVIDRKSSPRPIFVPRAAVSVCGTIQPKILRKLHTPDYFASGLSARLLIVEPPNQQKQWREVQLPEQVIRRFEDTVGRLLGLGHQQDEDGESVSIDLPLTQAAKANWIAFYNDFAREQHETGDDDLAAAFSKQEGYTARLALLFQLIRWADGRASGESIDAESMNAAITLTRWFVDETQRIYGSWRPSVAQCADQKLIEWIRARGGSTTARDVQRGLRRYRDNNEAAEAALERLVQAKKGVWDHKAGGGPGPPSKVFRLNDPQAGDAIGGDRIRDDGVENGDSVAVATVAGTTPPIHSDPDEESVWEE